MAEDPPTAAAVAIIVSCNAFLKSSNDAVLLRPTSENLSNANWPTVVKSSVTSSLPSPFAVVFNPLSMASIEPVTGMPPMICFMPPMPSISPATSIAVMAAVRFALSATLRPAFAPSTQELLATREPVVAILAAGPPTIKATAEVTPEASPAATAFSSPTSFDICLFFPSTSKSCTFERVSESSPIKPPII